MLLNKAKETTPMDMSVEHISISGKNMIDILGPPHYTNSENIKSRKIGFADEVSWVYDFIGVKVKIEYDSTHQSQLEWSRFPKDKQPKSIKLKPTEQCEEATLIGKRFIVNFFLKPYLYSLVDDMASDEAAKRAIQCLFEVWKRD